VSALLPSIPHVENRGRLVEPLTHGYRRTRVDYHNSVLVSLGHRLDQLVLARREVHGAAIEILPFEEWRVTHHYDRYVRLGRQPGRFLSQLRLGGRSIVGERLALHRDSQRVSDPHLGAGALPEAIERVTP